MPRGVPNVVKTRKVLDTTDHEIGQAGTVTMSSTGEAVLDKPEIQVVEGPMDAAKKHKADILAFMNEPVLVEVATTTDKYEPQFVQLWNDGRIQVIPRGIPTTVKRKYVEVLARMKTDTFRNEEYRDPDGNNSVRWPKTTGLRYPFAVIQDDNPKGMAWLRSIPSAAA